MNANRELKYVDNNTGTIRLYGDGGIRGHPVLNEIEGKSRKPENCKAICDGIKAAKKCSADTPDKTMINAFFIFRNGFVSSQSHSSSPFTMSNGELRN
jgi:hypothetical protein